MAHNEQCANYIFKMATKYSKWRPKLNKLNKLEEEKQCLLPAYICFSVLWTFGICQNCFEVTVDDDEIAWCIMLLKFVRLNITHRRFLKNTIESLIRRAFCRKYNYIPWVRSSGINETGTVFLLVFFLKKHISFNLRSRSSICAAAPH